MLSTAQKVKALNQATAGHCCQSDVEDGVYYFYIIIMSNKADAADFYGSGLFEL